MKSKNNSEQEPIFVKKCRFVPTRILCSISNNRCGLSLRNELSLNNHTENQKGE